jgi:hypothetical protein
VTGDQASAASLWPSITTSLKPSHDKRRVCQAMPTGPTFRKARPCLLNTSPSETGQLASMAVASKKSVFRLRFHGPKITRREYQHVALIWMVDDFFQPVKTGPKIGGPSIGLRWHELNDEAFASKPSPFCGDRRCDGAVRRKPLKNAIPLHSSG